MVGRNRPIKILKQIEGDLEAGLKRENSGLGQLPTLRVV